MYQPMDIVKELPVRRSKSQKTQFLDTARAYAEDFGYDVKIEKGSMGARNMVLGDPSKAKYLVTAHYDTPARFILPNLITPCNLPLFISWQILLVIVLLLPGVIAGIAVGIITDDLLLGEITYYVVFLILILLLYFGPANPSNVNDNTSGVVGVLEIASKLPVELREQVCFVLFDLEEMGLIGSAFYRKAHQKEISSQLIINLDCIGEGNDIILFPTGKLKKNAARISRFSSYCRNDGAKTVSIRSKGTGIYPSDQSNFPYGFGVAAMCRNKLGWLYLAKIHTPKDKILEEKNVALIRDTVIDIIRDRA